MTRSIQAFSRHDRNLVPPAAVPRFGLQHQQALHTRQVPLDQPDEQ
ncbi:MAG TPA: hypothetical protein VF460_02280 [Burkholderiales bacterium]